MPRKPPAWAPDMTLADARAELRTAKWYAKHGSTETMRRFARTRVKILKKYIRSHHRYHNF